MDIKLIIAIIRRDKLEAVEQKLRDTGAKRIDVSKVKGYGEYHDFFARDWMVDEVRIEVFTRKDEVGAVTAAIMDAAHTGLPGDGVVATRGVPSHSPIPSRGACRPRAPGCEHPS